MNEKFPEEVDRKKEKKIVGRNNKKVIIERKLKKKKRKEKNNKGRKNLQEEIQPQGLMGMGNGEPST